MGMHVIALSCLGSALVERFSGFNINLRFFEVCCWHGVPIDVTQTDVLQNPGKAGRYPSSPGC